MDEKTYEDAKRRFWERAYILARKTWEPSVALKCADHDLEVWQRRWLFDTEQAREANAFLDTLISTLRQTRRRMALYGEHPAELEAIDVVLRKVEG